MGNQFEYGMMVETGELKPGMADATAGEVSRSLTLGLGNIVQKASKGLETLEGGGWVIVSHDLTRIERHLVLSLLVRRDK